MEHSILSILIFAPIVLSLPLLFFSEEKDKLIKIYSITVSALVFLLSLYLYFSFDDTNAGFQFMERFQWVNGINVYYLVGIDGISLLLVMLTTFIFPLTILAMWNSVKSRIKIYYFVFLLLEGSLLGVFLSLDLILFYVFWELILIPMYFLIGIWGGKNRYYATVKFFLYTMFGSLLMLVAIIWSAKYSSQLFGHLTTDFFDLQKATPFIPFNIQLMAVHLLRNKLCY